MNLSRLKNPIIYIVLGLVIFGLSVMIHGASPQMQRINTPTLSVVPTAAWSKLAQKHIWFGHQSVGWNIVEGLQDVMKEQPQIAFNIVEAKQPEQIKTPGLTHFAVGQNSNPASKIIAFTKVLENAQVKPPDIAFFKFCFLDINNKTDVTQVFRDYQTAMDQLIQTFPGTTFIQVTVPLTTEPTGRAKWLRTLKYGLTKMINRPVERSIENLNRTAFNELIRKTYGKKSTVFDLAQIESIAPDHQQATFSIEGKPYHALVPVYTDDGAHLNKVGRKVMAEQLLIFLAQRST